MLIVYKAGTVIAELVRRTWSVVVRGVSASELVVFVTFRSLIGSCSVRNKADMHLVIRRSVVAVVIVN
jgi:hypothetical protein